MGGLQAIRELRRREAAGEISRRYVRRSLSLTLSFTSASTLTDSWALPLARSPSVP